jgi:PAS domain S-box-containing protein
MKDRPENGMEGDGGQGNFKSIPREQPAVSPAEPADELNAMRTNSNSTEEALRSLKEKLYSANEEIRALREELATVKAELRQKAEVEMRESEATLRGILNAARESIWLFSADGRVLLGNETALARWARPPETIIGKTFAEALPGELASARLARVRETVESKGPVTFEDERAGISFEHRFYPVLGIDGNVERVAAFSRDVTQRKRSEETLRRYELLANHSRDIVLFLRRDDGRILEANAAAALAYGYSRDELLALSIHDLRGPHSEVQIEALMAQADLHGVLFETMHLRRDGSMFPVEVSSRGATIAGVRTLVSIVRDITLRKYAEEALRASEARLQAHMENSPLAVIEFDPEFRVTRWSQESARLFGWNAGEILGRSILEMRWVHEEDAELVARESAGLLSGERPRSVSVNRNYRKDGSILECEWYNSAIYDGKGRLVSVMSLVRDVTASRSAELERERLLDELQHHTAVLDATLASMADGVVIYGADGRLRSANQAAQEILHYTPAEQATMDVAERTRMLAFTKEDGSPYAPEETPVAKALRGEATRGAIMVVPRSGPKIWISVSAGPIRGPGGELWGAVSMVSDITKRKQIEERIAWLASFPQCNPLPITEVSLSGKIHYVNPSAQRLFPDLDEKGLDHAWLGNWVEVMHELESNASPLWERLVTVGDSFYWQSLHILPEVRRVRIYGRDVTARTRMEQALREGEARYRTLFETMTEGFSINEILCDERGKPNDLRYLEVNPAFERHTGLKAADIVGHTTLELFPQAEPIWFERYGQVALGGESGHFEGHFGPLERDFEVSAYPIKPGRFAVVFFDITERKRAEKSLQEANQRLYESNRRKNEFLAMLSHELRNPLAPIRNSLHVLERVAPDSESARRAKTIIEHQTSHMTRLVDDLLDITRISRGKIHLQRTSVDCCEVVRRTTEDTRPLFSEKGIELHVSLPDKALWIDGDSTRLVQAIGNLLHNAMKYTTPGGHVWVSLAKEKDGAVLRVRDSGVGISQDLRSRLFEPFTQGESTLDRGHGGLGLGLALVKGLVELHGGSVSAHSDGIGRGAEFVVRLPVVTMVAVENPSAPSSGKSSNRRRVLVIEDNIDAASSLCEVLKLGEHEVAVAHSGPEGLAGARVFRPEIVLCDIGLPGMDGYKVARAFRADIAFAGIFLVAVSGYTLPEDLQRAEEAGFDRHLAKPPSLEKLEELLTRLGS